MLVRRSMPFLSWALTALVALLTAPAFAVEPPPAFVARWGHLGPGQSSFHNPFSAAIAADGLLYIADQVNNRVSVWTRDGVAVRTFPVPSDLGPPNPTGIAYNRLNGLLYVSQHHTHRISVFTTAGDTVSTLRTKVTYPVGVATDASGFVYVAVSGEDKVVKFTANGDSVLAWTVNGSPYGVAVDGAGAVYVSGYYNHQVRKFTSDGAFITSWGSQGSGDGQFQSPEGMWVDAVGRLFVCDTGNDRIQKFTGSGTFLTKWGTRGSNPGQFYTPSGIVGDASGDLYVVEWNNHRVQKFSYGGPTPVRSETWGSLKSRYRGEGTAKQAQDR